MTSPHLEPLKRKLLKAALDLISRTDADEFNSFDLIAGGRRLVIEVAVLPPVTQECEGAQRTKPQPTVVRSAAGSRRRVLRRGLEALRTSA